MSAQISRAFRTSDGTEIRPGDKITDFRGDEAVFHAVTRPADEYQAAKIQVGGPFGMEYYASVFPGLVVYADSPDSPVTDVIFRAWDDPEFGTDVVALFPGRPGKQPGTVLSYERAGGHGSADLAGVLRQTRPAVPEEYAALRHELGTAPHGCLLAVVQPETVP